MPIVTIQTWPMAKEMKTAVIWKVTEVFVGLGIPAQAVTVVIHENEMENWGSAGEQHSVMFADMRK